MTLRRRRKLAAQRKVFGAFTLDLVIYLLQKEEGSLETYVRSMGSTSSIELRIHRSTTSTIVIDSSYKTIERSGSGQYRVPQRAHSKGLLLCTDLTYLCGQNSFGTIQLYYTVICVYMHENFTAFWTRMNRRCERSSTQNWRRKMR